MTGRQRSSFVPRTSWSHAQLKVDRRLAEEAFRQERIKEPLEAYLAAFKDAHTAVETLLTATLDLAQLDQEAARVLGDPTLLEAFRYLAAPPISLDDLHTPVNTSSLSPIAVKKDPAILQRMLETIHTGLDPRRFPWVAEGRRRTEGKKEQGEARRQSAHGRLAGAGASAISGLPAICSTGRNSDSRGLALVEARRRALLET